MHHLNIEIKAKCPEAAKIRQILEEHKADFKGLDHQIDTYFNCNEGRLKLREGNIENSLIHYMRVNQEGPKRSEVILYKTNPDSKLKGLLTAALGIKTVVDKKREIYFIENVKFHIDEVRDLGAFVEIEAIDYAHTIGEMKLLQQCNHYMDLFELNNEALVAHSYSDLMLGKSF